MQVKEFNEFIEKMYELKAKKDELSEETKKVSAELELAKKKALEYLEQAEMTKYAHPKGTVFVQNKFSAKVPKDEESKKQLFKWLKEKGISMQYLTVNSNSLNSLYKAELEANGPDFKMPGVEEPQLYQQLAMRSK